MTTTVQIGKSYPDTCVFCRKGKFFVFVLAAGGCDDKHIFVLASDGCDDKRICFVCVRQLEALLQAHFFASDSCDEKRIF